MGCDIHAFAERRDAGGKWGLVPEVSPFDWRSYGLFGWLANVRNYSNVPPLSQPRGLPEGVCSAVLQEYEEWGCAAHSPSWVALADLLAFDYEVVFVDRRRVNAQGQAGVPQTYREFLGPHYFENLEWLDQCGVERVVFWFDN